MAAPAGRFSLAFAANTLDWTVTWTALDQLYPNLVVSYTIDRGRQYELDHTDTGRAQVTIADPDGILDPTNTSGPYWDSGFGIQPLRQAAIARWNPVAAEWQTRFRGFIEELDYTYDPSQKVSFLTISLVDLFEILANVEMVPGVSGGAIPFGDDPATVSPDSVGQIAYGNKNMDDRINQALDDALGATAAANWTVVFSGNVECATTVYSPGEPVLNVIQDAADAEFPGVSNVYCSRDGRLAVHGRLAKFDPAGTFAGATPGSWDWHHWKAGDGTEVAANPSTTAHIRTFGYNRGLAKVINSAMAYPAYKLSGSSQVPVDDTDLAPQTVSDTTSQGRYGIRSWSAPNLVTLRGLTSPGYTSLEETKKFANFYVANYADPRNRISQISFRSIRPSATGAAANWSLLSQIDIADLIDVTVDAPGNASSTGGFVAEPYFVEGIHEQVQPLNANYDDVTLTLDLSPQAYFTDTTMFPGE
jgi:hypothetical protein